MPRRIAPIALIALEFRDLPFHDPFHGQAVDRRWPPRQQAGFAFRVTLPRDEIWRTAVSVRTRGTRLRSASCRWVMTIRPASLASRTASDHRADLGRRAMPGRLGSSASPPSQPVPSLSRSIRCTISCTNLVPGLLVTADGVCATAHHWHGEWAGSRVPSGVADGFQDRSWFTTCHRYLGFQHARLLRRPRSSRTYPARPAIYLIGLRSSRWPSRPGYVLVLSAYLSGHGSMINGNALS